MFPKIGQELSFRTGGGWSDACFVEAVGYVRMTMPDEEFIVGRVRDKTFHKVRKVNTTVGGGHGEGGAVPVVNYTFISENTNARSYPGGGERFIYLGQD